MNRIVKVSQPAALASEALGPEAPVAVPLGEPVARTRLLGAVAPDNPVPCGVWECSPGRWRRQVARAEFSHFLAGRCRFVPDEGEPLTLAAGDAVYFPPGSHGTWEVEQTVRKVFVIFDPA